MDESDHRVSAVALAYKSQYKNFDPCDETNKTRRQLRCPYGNKKETHPQHDVGVRGVDAAARDWDVGEVRVDAGFDARAVVPSAREVGVDEFTGRVRGPGAKAREG